MCKSGCFSFIFFLMTAMVMHLRHNSDGTRVQCISVCTLCTSDARLVGVLATNMEIEIWKELLPLGPLPLLKIM